LSRTRLQYYFSRKQATASALALALALTAPLFVSNVQPASAQTPTTTIPGLSATQKQQVAARRVKLQKDLDALAANKKLTEPKKQKAFEKLEADYASDIAALLTLEQKKAIIDKQSEESALRKKREAEFHDVTVKIMTLSDKIAASLTPDQSKKLDQIKLDAKDKAQKISSDTTLNAAQKSAANGKLEDAMQDQVQAILTPDQKKMFNDMDTLEQRQIQLMNGAKPKS